MHTVPLLSPVRCVCTAGRSSLSKALQSDILNLDITNFFGGDKNSQDGKGSCLMPLTPTQNLLFGYAIESWSHVCWLCRCALVA